MCFTIVLEQSLTFLFLSVIKKLAQYIGEVLEDSKDKVQENLLASGGRPYKTIMFLKCCLVVISIQMPMITDGINYAQMFRNCSYSFSDNSFYWQFLSHWNQGRSFVKDVGKGDSICFVLCFKTLFYHAFVFMALWPCSLIFVHSVKKYILYFYFIYTVYFTPGNWQL